jgi:hypothetical protein
MRPRGLSQLELGELAVWFVAAGRWAEVGLSEAEGRDLVCHFFKCLKSPAEDSLQASYLSLQNTFMAMRNGTFESIQSEPPFSRFGRRGMKAFVGAWLEGGEAELKRRWVEVFCPGWRHVQQDRAIRITGGQGATPETPIELVTDSSDDKIFAEYWYLYYQHGKSWRCEMQMSTLPDSGGRRYDVLHLRFHDGQERRLYFLLRWRCPSPEKA